MRTLSPNFALTPKLQHYLPSFVFPGACTAWNAGTADRQKGTVKIEVQIARPDLQIIKPEMSAKVSFLEPKSKFA